MSELAQVMEIITAALMTPGPNERFGLPVLLEGPPGVGKTTIIRSLVRKIGLPSETFIASIREPTDFSGLPLVGEDGTIVRAVDRIIADFVDKPGVLFFDELNAAPIACQKAALRVIHEGVVGDQELDLEVRFIAAQNGSDEATGCWDLDPPLANRFGHFRFPSPSPQQWGDYMLGFAGRNGQVAGNYEELKKRVLDVWKPAFAKAAGIVTGFMSRRPELLFKQPKPGDKAGSKAWPSPRCYDAETDVLTARGWLPWPDVCEADQLATIGPDGAMTFTDVVKLYKAPYAGDMYSFKAQHVDLLVTPGHKMYWAPDIVGGSKPHRDKIPRDEFGLSDAQQLRTKLTAAKSHAARFRSDADWVGCTDNTRKKIGERYVAWDDWAEFLGWWLTDGCAHLTTQGSYPAVKITQVDETKRGEVARLFAAVGCKQFWLCADRVIAHDQALFDELLPLGGKHAGERYVPRDVMARGTSTLRALLRGAIGGDGWFNKGTTYICVGHCKQLAGDLQEAAIKSGGSGRVSTRMSTHGKTLYTVSVMGRRYSRPVITASHISVEHYDGMVYCAEVAPHHTLLVRRNGHAVWCGNSWENATRALASAEIHGMSDEVRDIFVGGFVGDAAAQEFSGWLRDADLPDPIKVLDGLVKFDHDPHRLDRTAAVINACTALVVPEACAQRDARATRLWELLASMCDDAPDIAMIGMEMLVRNTKLGKLPAAKTALAGVHDVTFA